MAALTVSQALGAIRDTINDGDIGVRAYYPARGVAPSSRCIFLFSNTGTLTAGNEQVWLEQPRAILLLGKADDAGAMQYADELIEPLVDLFDPTVTAGYTLGDRIHRCTVVSYRTGLVFEWGGLTYYAAEFLFDLKRRRYVGDGT